MNYTSPRWPSKIQANKQESCLQRKSTSFSGAQEKPTRSGDTGTSREPWRAAGKAVVGPAAWAAPAPLQGPGASQHLRVQPGPPSQRSHLSAHRHLEKLNVCLCESTLSQDNDPAASSSASPFLRGRIFPRSHSQEQTPKGAAPSPGPRPHEDPQHKPSQLSCCPRLAPAEKKALLTIKKVPWVLPPNLYMNL